MKNILITGFETFGDYTENLSEIAATKLKIIGDYNVYGLVFSVRIGTINYGDIIVAKAKEINACAIISLGISSDVRGIRIETRAINWVENYKYCLESEQRRVLDENLITKKELMVDLNKWHLVNPENLNVLIDQFNGADCDCNVSLSDNAGAFCCNALMFRTLISLQKNKCEIPYLFLHIPCSKEAVKNITHFDQTKDLMSLEKLGRVLAIILEYRENQKKSRL